MSPPWRLAPELRRPGYRSRRHGKFFCHVTHGFGSTDLLGATVQHRVIASKSRLQDKGAPNGCRWESARYRSFQSTEPGLFFTDPNSLSKADNELQDSLIGGKPTKLVRGDFRNVRPGDSDASHREPAPCSWIGCSDSRAGRLNQFPGLMLAFRTSGTPTPSLASDRSLIPQPPHDSTASDHGSLRLSQRPPQRAPCRR